MKTEKVFKWTDKEVKMLLGYIESDDSEFISDRIEFERHMLHKESGFKFPLRSASAAKNKMYSTLLKNKSLLKENI